MLTQSALIALPMALVWVILTNQVSIESFGIGYALSFGIAALLARGREVPLAMSPMKLPGQLIATTLYTLRLTFDILMAGIDVSLRVMGFRPLNPGIIEVDTEDPNDDDVISGLSAHGITITPGELVVDFSDDGQKMYVHVLNIDDFAPSLGDDQKNRLKMFRRMLGYD